MKPTHRLAIAFFVAAIIIGAATLRWLDPEPAVYEAAVAGIYSSDVAVVSSPSVCGVEAIYFPGISPSLVDAFRSANVPGSSLGDISGLRTHFAIANSAQVAALESQGHVAQTAGSSQIPLVRISRVGFNADKSEALLCIRAPYGSALVYLRKVDGTWRVESDESISVVSLAERFATLSAS